MGEIYTIYMAALELSLVHYNTHTKLPMDNQYSTLREYLLYILI